MKVLFLCEGSTIPASRFRVVQFLRHFENAGIEPTVRYGYGERYNEISKTRLSTGYRLLQRLKRSVNVADVGRFDLVFCQRPAIPQSSLPEELLAKLNPRVVFDFDDSIWLGAKGVNSPRRRQAFEKIAGLSTHLIAGNRFLENAAGHPEKTTVIPTVIDTKRYCPGPSASEELVIGWMGTSGNFPFLERVVPSLLRVLKRHPEVRFRLVANAPFAPLLGHSQVDQVAWSALRELDLLRSFSIGLMPLIPSDLTRGKCAFKMIMYMAVGTPVLVSDVGANSEVMGAGKSGYLLSSFNWDRELSELIESRSRREQMGRSGREQIVASYSVDAVLPRYLEIFEQVSRL